VAATVVDQLADGIGDANELCVREYCRRAITELVVELASDQQHHVGIGHCGRPDCADHGRMIGGDEAAALLGVEIERVARIEQAHEVGAGVPGASPGDHQRPPRRPQGIDRERDV
jgi:hypothetical protein